VSLRSAVSTSALDLAVAVALRSAVSTSAPELAVAVALRSAVSTWVLDLALAVAGTASPASSGSIPASVALGLSIRAPELVVAATSLALSPRTTHPAGRLPPVLVVVIAVNVVTVIVVTVIVVTVIVIAVIVPTIRSSARARIAPRGRVTIRAVGLCGAAAGVLRCGDDRPGIAAGASGTGRRQTDGGRTPAAPSRHSGPPSGAWSPWSARSSTRGRGLGLRGGGGELNQGATGTRCQGSRPDRTLP
jgi:hypothetical protein